MSRPGQGLSTLRPAHRPSKTNVVRQLPSLLLGILGASRYRFRDAAGRIGWDHRAERRRQDNSAAADVRYYTAHLWGNQGGGADRPDPGARRRLRLGDDGPPKCADQRRGPWTAPVGYTQARTVDRRVCLDRPVYRSAGAALFRRHALAVYGDGRGIGEDDGIRIRLGAEARGALSHAYANRRYAKWRSW